MSINQITRILVSTFCTLIIVGCNGSSDGSGSRTPEYREGSTYIISGTGGFGPHPILTDTFRWELSLSEILLLDEVVMYDAQLYADNLSIGAIGTIDDHTHGMDCYDEITEESVSIDSIDGTIDISVNPFDEKFEDFDFDNSIDLYSARILLINGLDSDEAHICVTYTLQDEVSNHQIYRRVSIN